MTRSSESWDSLVLELCGWSPDSEGGAFIATRSFYRPSGRPVGRNDQQRVTELRQDSDRRARGLRVFAGNVAWDRSRITLPDL
jgi:hypothetical protein